VKRCSLGRFFASGESTRQVLSPKGHNGGITLQITDFINTIDPKRSFEAFTRLAYRPLVTDRAMEAWYHPSIA
jgi:hypothetical protein